MGDGNHNMTALNPYHCEIIALHEQFCKAIAREISYNPLTVRLSFEMERHLIALFVCTIFGAISCCEDVNLTFPSGFRLGTGSSSYQVEGAWNASDKGENAYDFWLHNSPEDPANGDIACNSYYKYKEDVAFVKSIGLDFYRFSISWSRVLPTGFDNVISEDGIQYYKNLTAELVANGIEPIVTMYHWDHPQIIEEMGGWTNELIVDWFVDYARVLFEALGDNVKKWVTINQPDGFCFSGYQGKTLAPGKLIYGIGGYLCGHNVLKAHAKTYRMYDKEFRATQQGQIGITLPIPGYLPANSSYTEAAETAFQFNAGWMAHPIYIGDYPEIMKTRVALISEKQGYSKSRLPEFSEEWISIIKGTADFLGINHYGSFIVSPDPDEELGIYNSDKGTVSSVDPSWPATAGSPFRVYPPGFGYMLRKIRDEYDNPLVWVMENGYSDNGELDDYDRISYFYEYLREMLIAIKRDGCNVEGYSVWSLLDSFEWSGYEAKYGLVSVDFDDADRTRSAKLSASWWKRVLEARKLQAVPTNSTSQTRNIP